MQHGFAQPQARVWPQAPAQNHMSGLPITQAKTGGMITTKYAPPPGYVPPVALAAPYTAWSHTPPGVTTQQAYDASAAQAQQYWAAYSGYHYPNHPGYAAYQYYQQYAVPPYAQPGAAVYPPAITGLQSPHSSTSHPAPASWSIPPQPPNLVEQAARHRHKSTISLNTESSSGHSAIHRVNGPNDDLDESHEDYCEYTRPCYYASRESEIVKELSIGLVHMKTALPAHKALPATWLEANEIALVQAPAVQIDADRCVSDYHSEGQMQFQLQSVRETVIWEEIKGDLIFRHLPSSTSDLIDISRLLSEFRNQRDDGWLASKPKERRPSMQQPQKPPSGQLDQSNKKRIFSQTDSGRHEDGTSKRYRHAPTPPEKAVVDMSFSSRHFQHTVTASGRKEDMAKGMRKETQDEVLARLGVTGAPKPVHLPSVPHIGLPTSSQQEHGAINVDRSITNGSLTHSGAEPGRTNTSGVAASPSTLPSTSKESQWTRLAREYQLGDKRSYEGDIHSHEEVEMTGPDITNGIPGKRRK